MNIGMIPAKYAQLKPEAPALIDHASGARVSYRELDEHVRRLANGLLSLGLTTGDRVAILAQNCTEIMALFFACGRVGLIAQPLNWRLAAPALEEVIVDGSPRVVITQNQYVELASGLQPKLGCVEHWLSFGSGSDGSYELLIRGASSAEPIAPKPVVDTDPLYILYTGGSTGASKGVLHTHKSTLCAMMTNIVGERIGPDDVYMLTGPMFHSPVVMAITYLFCGCPVLLMTFEPREAMKAIEDYRISAFIAQPTMVTRMLALEDFDDYDVSSLRHIMYGGGPVPPSVVEQAIARFGCNFIGVYGQTEGIAMTFLGYQDHVDAVNGIHPERLGSCGRETLMTSLKIVDESGSPVPRDGRTTGEIIVRSDANMVGYWQRPDVTAQTVRDGWMWTGDLARWDEDGYVFIVDRAKDMIISGGENIYSVQVEEAIHRHPAVLMASVIGIPDDEWGEAVMAFVVLKPGMEATAAEIIDVTRQHLASYQKPRFVEFVDGLPTAPTGKIMKHVLRAPYWADRTVKV